MTFDIKIEEENLEDRLVDELLPKLRAHWTEAEKVSDNLSLSLDLDKYKMLSDIGWLKIFTARQESKLVGYAVFILNPNLQVANSFTAVNNALFVDKPLRKLGLGKALLEFSENELKSCGVHAITLVSKDLHPLDGLYESLGYWCEEHTFLKLIKAA